MSNNPNPEPEFFNNGELYVEYAKWGHGPHVLIAFHGFGRNYSDFIPFTQALESDFTIYGVDLFFHGNSNIGDRAPDKDPLTPEELKTFFSRFLAHINTDACWLMGYSLGGRIALKIAELMPVNVSGLYLFAPDGLKVDFWYAFSSFTTAGRAAFRFMISHNAVFFKLLDAFNAIGIVSDKRKTFVLSQIKSTEAQWQIYHTWTFLRLIAPNFGKLGPELKQKKITVDLFLGKYDKIIPPKTVRRFQDNFPELRWHIVDSGHAMLRPGLMEHLLEGGLLRIPE